MIYKKREIGICSIPHGENCVNEGFFDMSLLAYFFSSPVNRSNNSKMAEKSPCWACSTTSKSEVKNEVVNKLLSMKSKPNSEKTIFGKAPPYALYIAAQCKPMQGLHEFQKLMKAFPKHPSYPNFASNNGLTKTQELFYMRRMERD